MHWYICEGRRATVYYYYYYAKAVFHDPINQSCNFTSLQAYFSNLLFTFLGGIGVVNSKKLSGQELVLTDFAKYCLKMPHILRKKPAFLQCVPHPQWHVVPAFCEDDIKWKRSLHVVAKVSRAVSRERPVGGIFSSPLQQQTQRDDGPHAELICEVFLIHTSDTIEKKTCSSMMALRSAIHIHDKPFQIGAILKIWLFAYLCKIPVSMDNNIGG